MKQGWTYKKLGELGTIVTGSTPSTKIKEYYCSNDYCFIKPSDLPAEGYQIIVESENYISSKGYEVSRKLPKGSVLVSCIGIIGKTAILGMDACTNQQINAIIPNEYVNNKFLAYSILSQRYVLSSVANAPVVPLINKSDFSKVEIPLPPLSTQLSIVSELDKINELIRLKKEQLKDYDNLAQSIFYEMFGDPIENEKGWEVKKLGDVCEVSSFKRVLVEDVLEKGPVPFIRGTELSAICKENKREYKMYITMEHYERVKNISGVPNVGDLLIPSINAEGLVWVVDTPEPMYYKDGRVLWVHVDQNSISSIALQRILNNLIKDNYSKITNGAVFAELNLSILRSFPIILPPLSIQNAFANKINLIEKQKAEIQSTIADLETLLASRMQYWFD